METIERNATTQAQLIEDILDVSQIIRGKMRLSYGPANLVGVVEAAVNAVRLAAEAKQLKLTFELAVFDTPLSNIKAEIQNPQFNVWGDSVRLQQVVWNLLTNAIKFTLEQGKVQIRLERKSRSIDQPIGKLNAEAQPPHSLQIHALECLQIQVTDTGSGIDPTFLPKVFDRFRQADSTTTRLHNGLGLGLAIVRHIVEQHGGTIEAASPGLDQGATFTVTLPCLHRLDTGNGSSSAPRNSLTCQPQLSDQL